MFKVIGNTNRSLIRQHIEADIKNCNVAKIMKPIMSEALELEVNAAVVQYKERAKWRNWGLAHYRKQGAAILLWGPPGTGKTSIAVYLASRIKMGLRNLDISTFGSGTPGENERKIAEFFAESKRDDKAIFIDECDSILWDRSKAGSDSMWMVAVINKLLAEISDFPHPMFLATNRMDTLDSALDRRLIAKIEIPRPGPYERRRIWEQKIPKTFPYQPTQIDLDELESFNLSGAEIENVIIRAASLAIATRKLPNFEIICNVATLEANKHA